MTGVVTFGETMGLLAPPGVGPLAHARTMELGIGGAESNVAIGLARLGVPVTWIGRVGADPIGVLVRREIAAEGVVARVIVDPDAPTGLMLKERRTPSASSVHYYRRGSAGSRLAPADIPTDLVRAADVLHVTGITPALSASASAATLHAMRVAHDAGVTVSLDLNFRSRLWSATDAGAWFRAALPLVDVVFAGEDEALLVVEETGPPERIAAALSALGPRVAIIKLGADGAIGVADGAPHRVQAVPITAFDTVGAGDAFAAGFLADLLATGSVVDALRTAALAGAFVCQVPGDWEGLPTRQDLVMLARPDRDPVQR